MVPVPSSTIKQAGFELAIQDDLEGQLTFDVTKKEESTAENLSANQRTCKTNIYF